MTVAQKYAQWLVSATDECDLVEELRSIADNEDAISDRFYRELEFGTGGLRGVIGAGENRMNVYTVRKATQGLADYLNARYTHAKVAIGYDSRIKSDRFAKETACVLAANGITVFLFSELQPTPVLSFAVRELQCQAGVMITASHNPAKYNGYKCYGPEGFQMTDAQAKTVMDHIRRIDIFNDVKVVGFEAAVRSDNITMLGQELVERFLDRVCEQQITPGICENSPLKIIYTPLNGTGNKPVRRVLHRIGVTQVRVVPEQELPDGQFPTVPCPNPEISQAFERALVLAKVQGADLLLATDPDCDRVGIAVKHQGEYVRLTGNAVGCLLLDYILSRLSEQNRLPAKPVVVKTIVTSDLAFRIAAKYGCEVREVLTGFKYIGEEITCLEQTGEVNRYIFGFEESYGYLAGSYVRDKDGVVASMLICEMASFYAKQGLSLIDVLMLLYKEHGVYRHRLINVEFEGAKGMAEMNQLMTCLRETMPKEIGGYRVLTIADYQQSVKRDLLSSEETKLTLPKSNVLSFGLEDGIGIVIRPSGTEPKVKAYITGVAESITQADEIVAALCKVMERTIRNGGVI